VHHSRSVLLTLDWERRRTKENMPTTTFVASGARHPAKALLAHVITSDGAAGRYGLTASAVCSVTDDPPTLTVCVIRASQSNVIFRANGILCVNTLSASQQDVSAVSLGSPSVSSKNGSGSEAGRAKSPGAPVREGLQCLSTAGSRTLSKRHPHCVLRRSRRCLQFTRAR